MIKTPLLDEKGNVVGIQGIFWDITEGKLAEEDRRNMEIQLRQAQKLEAIGQLAAGVAHEINSPTQFIGDNIQFQRDGFRDLLELLGEFRQLQQRLEEGGGTAALLQTVRQTIARVDLDYLMEELPRAIAQSQEGVERVTGIVRAMKEFSHPGTTELTPVDLNRAIESTIIVSRNEWKYVAELVPELEPGLPLVPCLPGEFNQVVLNLIVNAAHAIADVVGDGAKGLGTIRVVTRRVDEHWVEVRICDSGTGIPMHVRDRIFDPFFTTKGVGKGTGQGLAIARSVVVDKHQGTLEFETELGKGTAFVIRLPLKSGETVSGGEQ